MTYTPIPKNKKTEVASVVLFITSVILFFFGSQYYVKYRPVSQALGVVCLGISAFLMMKRLTSYTYTVYPKDSDTKKSVSELEPSELVFIVSKRNGKGAPVNRASLDLGTLVAAVPLPIDAEGKKKTLKSFGKTALYYYTVTFRPSDRTLLVFGNEGSERIGVVTELDGDFKGFLEEAVRINEKKKTQDQNET